MDAAMKAEVQSSFARRHIGPSPADVSAMLQTVGVASLDELIAQTLPQDIRQRGKLALPPALSEPEALTRARQVAAKNEKMTSLIGQGYYGTVLPPVIQRNILENPAWYTAYTPYQPEISQGRLEALLNFQTMVADLTGLEIANASLLDEATAAAEAMAMAQRITNSERTAFFVDAGLPSADSGSASGARRGAWLAGSDRRSVARPGCHTGVRSDLSISRNVRPHPRLARTGRSAARPPTPSRSCAADPLALAILKPPGEVGADIAIGSMQRFGVPMGYGGPHAAYIATKDVHKRALPGRLVGVSIDSRGNRAYRLALQTREQHIRREKATSNICTAQVLLAVDLVDVCCVSRPGGAYGHCARVFTGRPQSYAPASWR